jgi:hypothetical protein
VVDALTASGVGAIFDSLGGAVAKLTPTDTAFPHRTALASVQIFRSTSASAASAVAAVRDELGTLLGPHGYVNYIDPAMPHWPAAYYGGNVARLQSVARRYDPNAVFAFAQGLAG